MTVIGVGLGEYLRSVRHRLQPHVVGLPAHGGTRRVPGLRRDEVAVLAGISTDYYIRLEQGRERSPSPRVVFSLCNALRLTPDASEHLCRLAGIQPTHTPGEAGVHPALMQLLQALPHTAAYILGPALDVVAANATAQALLHPFGTKPNMPAVLFTHPQARTVFAELGQLRRGAIRALRLNAGRFPDDQRIVKAVRTLLEVSPEFAAQWTANEVGELRRQAKIFVLPDVGRIELTYQTFHMHDEPGQQLLVGTAEPGSRSEQALGILLSIQHQTRTRWA